MTENKNWHLEKSVSLGHLLTTIVLVLGLIGGYAQFSNRVAVLETQQGEINMRLMRILEAQTAVDTRQDTQYQVLREEIRDDLRGLAQKIDRLSEQLLKSGQSIK